MFAGNWSYIEDLNGDFFDSYWEDTKGDVKDDVAEIIYANYTCESYEGNAYVLFIGHDGLMYEVHGGHCSCYGLEGQWKPEPTSQEYVIERLKKNELGYSYYSRGFASELMQIMTRRYG